MAEIDSFFKYKLSDESTENIVLYQIEFNQNHQIFIGHFPDQPVVPGVLIIRTIVECTCVHLQKKLSLKKATQCKFLNFVDPRKEPVLSLQLNIYDDGTLVDVKAVLKSEATIFTKAALILEDKVNA